jgi:hypothetical protein
MEKVPVDINTSFYSSTIAPQEALWKFFIEAGGFPKKIQCDFDPRFVGGQALKLLRSHGCKVQAAPPHRQSQNGMVERRWQMLEAMARTYLTEARLPKRFWYWAIREATHRINMLPITTRPDDPTNVDFLTTPFEAFYHKKPDYRTLFPFGCTGSFRRPKDGQHKRTTFESQGMLGIALGRSEFTNGMIFYNPILDSFSVSADYHLDKTRSIADVFLSIRYDGGLTTSVVSGRDDSPNTYVIGETVYVQQRDSDNILSGIVVTPPTTLTKMYTIECDDGNAIDADPNDLFIDGSTATKGRVPSVSLGFFQPEWMSQDTRVTLLFDDNYCRGYLNLDSDNDWEFVTLDNQGTIAKRVPLPDLQYSWKSRIQENSLSLGWQSDVAMRVCGYGRHVSAASLKLKLPPASLDKLKAHPDANVWYDAYDEERDGLIGLNTFVEINETEYRHLVEVHGEVAKAIPTMNIFTVKTDETGAPVRAKSRIVVLGNLEKRIWEKSDKYAPVISSSAN